MTMPSGASRTLASVEARLATAMELITSAIHDIARLKAGDIPQEPRRASNPISPEEDKRALLSPQQAQLLAMIESRKTGHVLNDIHEWSKANLEWDETATNNALTDLVKNGLLEEPAMVPSRGVTYVAQRSTERHIDSIHPKLLVAIMDALVSAMPLERLRDLLSTFSDGWTTSQIRTALLALRTDSYVRMTGTRRDARWEKVAELPDSYTQDAGREEVIEARRPHFSAPQLAHPRLEPADDFALEDPVPQTVRPMPEDLEDELLVETGRPTTLKTAAKIKKPVADRDWDSLELDALEDNGGSMDFEELVTHCKHYSSRYGFDTSEMSRTVVFNGLTKAFDRLVRAGKIKQNGQRIALIEAATEDDEDPIESQALSIIQQAAIEQHQVLPKPPKKEGRHKPATLTDWVWLVYDMILWAHEEHRRTLSIAGIAINLAKEPPEVRWTIADMDYQEVLRTIRVAIPFVLNNCPDVEEVDDGDRKKYGVISD